MSRKSQRNKLRRFIESLPVMAKAFDIKKDKVAKEISMTEGDDTIRFFYDKEKDSFIVFRKDAESCEIESVKFTHRETDRLNQLIDAFINNRLPAIDNTKLNKRGIKRIAPRAKDKNKK